MRAIHLANARFLKKTKTTLAERANYLCSNPDCRALTTGPAEEPDRRVSVGEAAHIYGANPGAARYNPRLIFAERRAITNAIWLCNVCHKKVDDDPRLYTADLLFEWRRAHEAMVRESVGKSGGVIRNSLDDEKIAPFKPFGREVQRIVLDKPDYWEFLLTIRILEAGLEPIFRDWASLKNDLFVSKFTDVNVNDFIRWQQVRIQEVKQFSTALSHWCNGHIQQSWGESGEEGSETEILHACIHLISISREIFEWMRNFKFTYVEEDFEPVLNHLMGAGDILLEKIQELLNFLKRIFSAKRPTGEHRIELLIELPKNWVDEYTRLLEHALLQHHLRQQELG